MPQRDPVSTHPAPRHVCRAARAHHAPAAAAAPALLLLLLALVAAPAAAHVPIMPGGNEDLAHAAPITDPAKSWAIYSTIHQGGEARYYVFTLAPGDRLYASLFVPAGAPSTPSLALMGPGIEPAGNPPAFLEVPDGAQVRAIPGVREDRPGYEPFTPAAMYEVAAADLLVTSPGSYYAAVYDPVSGGPFGLAIGYREEFSPVEWVSVPIDVLRIRLWEGQPPALIAAPTLITLAAGFLLIAWRRSQGTLLPVSLRGWAGSFGALLCLGSGITTFVQMGIALAATGWDPAALVTIVLVVLQVGVGLLALRVLLTGDGGAGTRGRVSLFLLGIAGIVVWAGFIAGPVCLLIAAVLPDSIGNETMTLPSFPGEP